MSDISKQRQAIQEVHSTVQEKRKHGQPIEGTELILGYKNPVFVPNKKLTIRFDKPNKIIELLVFKDDPKRPKKIKRHLLKAMQASQQQIGPELYDLRIIIKRQHVKKIHIDQESHNAEIDFKEAITYKYKISEWFTHQLMKNSKIRFRIVTDQDPTEKVQPSKEKEGENKESENIDDENKKAQYIELNIEEVDEPSHFIM